MLLAAYPFAIFFSAAYTESLFLLAALGAWHHLRRGQSMTAAGWGLLAGLARPNGCFLSIPLGLIALGVRDAGPLDSGVQHGRADTFRRLAVAAMPGVGMLLFTAYLHHVTGVWFAWSRMHEAWGRVFGADVAIGFVGILRSGNLLGLAAIILMTPSTASACCLLWRWRGRCGDSSDRPGRCSSWPTCSRHSQQAGFCLSDG